jgi:hypothetical protein
MISAETIYGIIYNNILLFLCSYSLILVGTKLCFKKKMVETVEEEADDEIDYDKIEREVKDRYRNIEAILDILEHLQRENETLKQSQKFLTKRVNYLNSNMISLQRKMKSKKTFEKPLKLRRSKRLMNMKRVNYKE